TGDRVFRAIDPNIMMIAAHDPFVRIGASGNSHDDVVEPLDIPVRLNPQMNLSWTRLYVIGDGQSAAPTFRGKRSLQRSQKWLRVAVGNRQNGNLGQGLRIFQLE